MRVDEGPSQQPDDVSLMVRVRSDDEDAFAELYRRHHRRVAGFFYGLSGDPQVAGDLRQETFLRIWRFRKRYAATGSFKAYVFSFARNIWLENCREIRRRRRLGELQAFEPESAPAGPSFRPDTVAARAELEGHILGALDKLPEDQRMAFVLRIVDGLSIGDIATIMQCPVNTVRSRKLLAIKKLRETLRKTYSL
ncbi:MAG TPA: sigma-70 family RNA polymerase sigma factor [Candidatus Hydrogenedentes bacterium]|nr:sigma-70 family RNA polymerase sigma factor [Candidatus Hydrogenedentota bacterium]